MSPINIIGNTCIITSLCSALVGITLAACRKGWRNFAYLNCLLMTLAVTVMVIALLTNDFSVSYVAQVGAIETPRFFAAISLWSSLEGSILLWGWILAGYTALCAFLHRNDDPERMRWVGVTLLTIGFFFYLVLAIPANPFHEFSPVPTNGPGPNPLLQNHWLMAAHPPLLYLGYVGMSVPFAFAIASLVIGDQTSRWIQMTRKWTLVAWTFLSVAILFGAWWSYAVLGWGGYWAWDPVENASFMPWLTATAFLHSVMVEERRQMLKVWNLLLICITFMLTLLGTFLTRSGILESVHSFTESGIGHYFFIGIATTLIVATGLLIWRGQKFRGHGRLDDPLCRESAFLLGNLLFISFCSVVLLGTLYPLIAEALRGIKVSVGEPFFNQMTVPIALAIILLMGIGVALPWRKTDRKALLRFLIAPAVVSILVTCLSFQSGFQKPMILLTIAIATLTLAILFAEMGIASWQLRSPIKMFAANPRRYGGFLVHMGIIVVTLGIALSKTYQEEQVLTLKTGESFTMGNYQVTINRVYAAQKPQRFELIAETQILRNGKDVGLLHPKLNFYPSNREPLGSPSIRSTFRDDLYLTLLSFEHDTHEVTLRALLTPAVSWIWSGGLFFIIGVLVAVSNPKRESQERLDGL